MKTLALFVDSNVAVPASTAWYLDALGEFRGKQELYTRQSPQKLRVLREHEWIRTVLAEMKKDGELECKGRGVAARWSVCRKLG